MKILYSFMIRGLFIEVHTYTHIHKYICKQNNIHEYIIRTDHNYFQKIF